MGWILYKISDADKIYPPWDCPVTLMFFFNLYMLWWTICLYVSAKIPCFNHRVGYPGCRQLSWGDSSYEKFFLVLEVNCISNLSPNHTFQLTTLRTAARESRFKKYDAFVVTLSQMFNGYYICKIMCCSCSLIQTGVIYSDHRCSVVTNCNILVVTWSGKLPLGLSYAISSLYTT